MEDINLYREELHPVPEKKLESLQVGDDSYDTILTEKYKKRKPYEPVNLKIVKAAIPGVMRKAYVAVGAKVKPGDKLVILEAMKMKNDILAVEGGIVEEICFKIGERVAKDEILVKIR
ncbi:MAG TPA: acetyl-CoA carboxylase biotin carboxyl carrier protein subunit [Bacteroidales bacterium]|nr:acetyl-CoA carboxylase biotin carboxyl carrier protein subunit [Bacteroidales bacterium]HRZ49855.1 acetyl-CoA carboxylase biotin carboxyl carrier protein subunit [Bacteroidales bacterium]